MLDAEILLVIDVMNEAFFGIQEILKETDGRR